MRILINASTAKMGGAKTYILNLIEELSRVDQENEYFIYLPEIERGFLEKLSSNVHLIEIGYPSLLKLFWWQQLILPKIIKKEKIDILFSTANFATYFCPCCQLLLLRDPRYFSKFYLSRKNNLFESIILSFRRFLLLFLAKRADILMFPSRSFLAESLEYANFPREKLVVLHYGVNIEIFSRLRVKRKKGSINLLCSGIYSEHKNYGTLFKALILLKKFGIKNFTFVAPIDWQDPLTKKCSNYKNDVKLGFAPEIKNNLNFIGEISYNQMPELYQKADIFLWPSLTETFGHPLVEAMASGLPIVASDIPINREICKDAALYFNPLDAKDLANKIKLVIEDDRLRQDLAERSQGRARLFSWENYTKKLLEIFGKMLESDI